MTKSDHGKTKKRPAGCLDSSVALWPLPRDSEDEVKQTFEAGSHSARLKLAQGYSNRTSKIMWSSTDTKQERCGAVLKSDKV